MSAVSLPAKNAARMSNPANAPKSSPKEGCGIRYGDGRASFAASSLPPMPPEHILEDELRTEISQRQHAETAQGPTDRGAPAPAETDAADQQHAEYRPRDQGQYRLVNQMLCEQIGDEDESREQRQREQREAGADQAKHDFLEGIERGQNARQVGDAPGAQPPIEKHQQQGRDR